jgi:hypothetical protein
MAATGQTVNNRPGLAGFFDARECLESSGLPARQRSDRLGIKEK